MALNFKNRSSLTPLVFIPFIPFIVICLSLYASNISAGEYKLVKGKRYSLCRDFLDNIKSLGSPIMACQLKLNPKFKQFRKFHWKTVDPDKYKVAIKQMFFISHRLKTYKNARNRSRLKKQFDLERDDYSPIEFRKVLWKIFWQKVLDVNKKTKAAVQHSRVDMDHDGDKENILLLDIYQCENIDYPFSHKYLVLEDNDIDFDQRYREISSSHLFYYQGRVRATRWGKEYEPYNLGEPETPTYHSLRIYDYFVSRRIGVRKVCQFNFYQNKRTD